MTWKLVKLGDVCHLKNGFAFKSKLFKDKGLPILRISNIQNERIDIRRPVYFNAKDYNLDLKKYEVKNGDLLIAMSGATTGKIGFNKSQTTFYLNQRVGKLVPGKDLDKKYLYYLLSTKVEENLKISKGAAQPNLSSEQIKNIEISLPSIPEQQSIVAKLDATFAEIDKSIDINNICLKNSNKLKEELINTVIKSIDRKYFKKFQDCCHFVRGPFGGSLTKSMFKDEGFVVYEQQHAIHNQFSKLRYFIDEIKFNEMKRFELNPGDLIMSCSGVTLGKIAIVPDKIAKGIINQALLKITPSQLILKDYLKIIMTSNYFQSILWDVSGGAAQPNVPSVRTIKDFLIPLIAIEEQKEIIKKINLFNELYLSKIYLNKFKELKSLKKSILKHSFTKNNSKAA